METFADKCMEEISPVDNDSCLLHAFLPYILPYIWDGRSYHMD